MREISAKELIALDRRLQKLSGQRIMPRAYRVREATPSRDAAVHRVSEDPEYDEHAIYFTDPQDAHDYVHIVLDVLPSLVAELMAWRAGVLDGEKPGFFARLRLLFGRGR